MTDGFKPFLEGSNVKWNTNSLIQVLNSGYSIPFPTTITITLWTPLWGPQSKANESGIKIKKNNKMAKLCNSYRTNIYRTILACCLAQSAGGGCRIHWLHLCRGIRPLPNECPGYDTKQSDGEVPAMLELWGMRSTPSLPSLPGPLWPRVVAPDKGPIYGLNRTNSILMLKWIEWTE